MAHTMDRLVFEVVNDEAVSARLDRLIRETLAACFPADEEHFSRDRSWHTVRRGWSWLSMRTARWRRIARWWSGRLSWGGHTSVPVAGVQGFSVLPGWARNRPVRSHHGARDREARRGGVGAGLLFCLPELERSMHEPGGAHSMPRSRCGMTMANPRPFPVRTSRWRSRWAWHPFQRATSTSWDRTGDRAPVWSKINGTAHRGPGVGKV